MKKKITTAMVIAAMSMSIMACGGKATETQAPATEAPTATETVAATEAESTIAETVESELAEADQGEVMEDSNMKKTPVYTNKNLNISGESGPMKYDVTAVQISTVVVKTDEYASLFEVEKDQEFTTVVFDLSAENTTDDTVNFYLGQATLTTDTKEQVEPDGFFSEYMDGEFLGNVIHSGTNVYILKNSKAEDIKNLKLHVDGPSDENYNSVGDDLAIEVNVE